MSPTSHPRDAEPAPERADRQYVLLELSTGDVVIYERLNHRAWIQSDGPVSLADAG